MPHSIDLDYNPIHPNWEEIGHSFVAMSSPEISGEVSFERNSKSSQEHQITMNRLYCRRGAIIESNLPRDVMEAAASLNLSDSGNEEGDPLAQYGAKRSRSTTCKWYRLSMKKTDGCNDDSLIHLGEQDSIPSVLEVASPNKKLKKANTSSPPPK